MSETTYERGSTTAMRNLIAREIWRYNECPWDFDNPPEGMAQLQKQLAVDQAEGIRKIIAESPLFKAFFAHADSADEDNTYEIGKRDGYESAVQDIDLATGGDGEFKGSTIPGGTVDVPAMKKRIIDRITAPVHQTGTVAEREAVLNAICGVHLNDGRALERVLPADECTRIAEAATKAAQPHGCWPHSCHPLEHVTAPDKNGLVLYFADERQSLAFCNWLALSAPTSGGHS